MDDPSHILPPPATGRRRRRRRLLTAGVAVIVVVGLAVSVAAARRDARPAGRTGGEESRHAVFVPTDRAVKAKMLRRVPQPPQLLIFGGSRATRFEPSYFQRKTGLRGFNLAFQNGRPEDAWSFLNFLHERSPRTRFRIVWFVHVEAFRAQGLSPGLVQDPELARWFPEALIAEARAALPRSRAEAPKGRDLALTRFGPDGAVLRNRYDIALERGRTLDKALVWSIDTVLERYATTTPALDRRSRLYFEKTLALANGLGATPVIVFMPLHPRLLAAVRGAGWDGRHREVRAYLRRLHGRYRFVVLDCSDLRSIRGDPDEYYDGFHVRRHNARLLVDEVVRRASAAFR